MDVRKIMTSPLTQEGRPGPFLRLVLSEAASYGMPAQVLATLDDVAAMLGFYAPLPAGQAHHLSGPLLQWQTSRHQPTNDTVADFPALAIKQRALIAFGGAPAEHRVGTAEIVVAMGNLHKETMPPAYYEIYTWAATDVMATVLRRDPETVRREREWPLITDRDVLFPGGRLHDSYIEIATELRRQAIGLGKDRDRNPRKHLRPLGVFFLRHHLAARTAAVAAHHPETVARIDEAIVAIRTMFPDIRDDETLPGDDTLATDTADPD